MPRLTGPIPENIRRCLPREERKDKYTMTNDDLAEKHRIKSERELQRQIVAWLRIKGIAVGWQRMDRKSNIVLGYPDIWFAHEGIPHAWEVKFGPGKQSPEQVKIQSQMEGDGWRFRVIRSLSEAVEALNA